MSSIIRTLLVDDEPLARRGMRQLLALHPDLEVVGECRNGHDALRALEDTSPGLVFLDVQMPEMDGFEVIRAFGVERMPPVVFVTAYDAYAVRAFETHALDYLVKPVTRTRFAATLARVRDDLASRDALALRQRLESALGERFREELGDLSRSIPAARRLVVSSAAGEIVLDAAEVDWIEADDYYAAVHAGEKRYLIRESLASLAARLDERRFARIHRSVLVNVERIREFRMRPPHAVVVLRNGREFPVSRRRREFTAGLLRQLRG